MKPTRASYGEEGMAGPQQDRGQMPQERTQSHTAAARRKHGPQVSRASALPQLESGVGLTRLQGAQLLARYYLWVRL